MKRCTKCGQEFPATAEYFYRDRHAADGLQQPCKTCAYEMVKAWRARHPEHYVKMRAYIRDYTKRMKADPDYQASVRVYRQRYYQTHRDQIRASSRRWEQQHRDKVAARQKRYRARHPERARAAWRRYYERIKDSPAFKGRNREHARAYYLKMRHNPAFREARRAYMKDYLARKKRQSNE